MRMVKAENIEKLEEDVNMLLRELDSAGYKPVKSQLDIATLANRGVEYYCTIFFIVPNHLPGFDE